jgi:hypothetical protein
MLIRNFSKRPRRHSQMLSLAKRSMWFWFSFSNSRTRLASFLMPFKHHLKSVALSLHALRHKKLQIWWTQIYCNGHEHTNKEAATESEQGPLYVVRISNAAFRTLLLKLKESSSSTSVMNTSFSTLFLLSHDNNSDINSASSAIH